MNEFDNEYAEWLDEREKVWLDDDECFEAFLEDLDRRINKINVLTSEINAGKQKLSSGMFGFLGN